MYCVELKKYVLCTSVRVDLSSDKESKAVLLHLFDVAAHFSPRL